jgi:hypothetical protein
VSYGFAPETLLGLTIPMEAAVEGEEEQVGDEVRSRESSVAYKKK